MVAYKSYLFDQGVRGDEMKRMIIEFENEQVQELMREDVMFDTEGNLMRFHSSQNDNFEDEAEKDDEEEMFQFFDSEGNAVDLDTEQDLIDQEGNLNKTFYDEDGAPIPKDIFQRHLLEREIVSNEEEEDTEQDLQQ